MAGQDIACVMGARGGLQFAEASPSDDSDIRQLLRTDSMPGWVRLGFEREPNYFLQSEITGESSRTLICRSGSGELLGMGTCSGRSMSFGGEEIRVSYLSQFRLSPRARGRRDVVVNGYRAMRELDHSQVSLTTIMGDNAAARRLLERGIRGLPQYKYLCDFRTFVMRPGRRRSSVEVAQIPFERPRIAAAIACINRAAKSLALAPHWTEEQLSHLILRGVLKLYVIEDSGAICAVAGKWDARGYRQIRTGRYAGAVWAFRPLINLLASVAGYPQLPSSDDIWNVQYLSHFCPATGDTQAAEALLHAVAADAMKEGCTLIAGACTTDPWQSWMKAQAVCSITSRVYAVEWEGNHSASSALKDRPIRMEVAQL